MKITIITVTLNSVQTIRDTLNSVCSQNYKNIEHIIVDGGSNDGTLSILEKYKSKKSKIFVKRNLGIYDAINYGIKKSSGKYISILNSDDIFQSNSTIEEMAKIALKNKKIKIFLGNVAYFDNSDYYNIKRYYSSYGFKKWKMKLGLMPPHPASLIKKEVYDIYGLYDGNFKIAADFEFFLRIFLIKKIKFKTINQTFIRMRTGGISGKNMKSYWISTIEIIKSFENNKLKTNIFLILMRIPVKIHQLFFFNKDNINKSFQLFRLLFETDYYTKNSFKIIANQKKIPFNQNFILSGMNLAFLGYYAKDKLFPTQSLYHWPDGIWLKNHLNINKIPGRDLFKSLEIPKKINNINVLGNLSIKSKKFLETKFKLKVFNQKLPFGNIKDIIKTKIELKKNSLILITLPTPKQEQLAYYISKKNSNYKIICIGASLAMASGEEKIVPNFMKNYEFLWRLKSDFFRRLKRLIESFFYYIVGKYIYKLYQNTKFIKID